MTEQRMRTLLYEQMTRHLGLIGKIRIHPLFILLLAGAFAAGMFRDALVLFIIVVLHELGHAAAANELGYVVERVSLLPFGGVAKLRYGDMGFHPRDEAIVAIAGPFVNLVLVLFAFVLFIAGIWSEEFYHLVMKMNLWIVVFNMLPGLPLDGGRILRAARCRQIGFESATREAYRVALIIAFTLMCIGGFALWSGHPHFGILILGVFLLLTAIAGRRDARMETMRFLDSIRSNKRRGPQIVRAIALQKSDPIRDAVVQFAPDRYHMLYVLSSDHQVEHVLEEKQVINCVFDGHWLTPIGDILDTSQK
jgi:stage IV sporulation protein FB